MSDNKLVRVQVLAMSFGGSSTRIFPRGPVAREPVGRTGAPIKGDQIICILNYISDDCEPNFIKPYTAEQD